MIATDSLYNITLSQSGEVVTKATPVSAGYSTGSPYLDTYNRSRAPSPYDLIRECLSTAYACATLNSDLVASTPLRLYVKTSRRKQKSRLMERGDTKALSPAAIKRLRAKPIIGKMISDATDVREVTNHPLLDLMNKPTNAGIEDGTGMSEYTLFELTQRYQEVRGVGYWYTPRDGVGGTPSTIWPLPAHLVQEIPDLSGQRVIDYYWYTGPNAHSGQRYEVHEIVPFRFPDLNTGGYFGGFSPLRACFEEVNLFRQHKAIVNAQLRNGGKPSAIWSPAADGSIGEAEAKRMRNAFAQAFGMSRAGGVMTMEQAGKLDILNWPMTNIISPEEFKMAKVSIANCFQVPTTKLDRNDANLASAKTGDYAHAKDAGLPRLRRNEAAINSFFVPMYDDSGQLFMAYDDPSGLHDEAMEFEKSKAAVSVGAVLRNEIRIDLGYDEVDWGNQPLANKDMVPVDLKTGVPMPMLAPVGPDGKPVQANGMQNAVPPVEDDEKAQPSQSPAAAAILALQTAYYGGTVPRDAAIANAVVVFGLSAGEAGKLFPVKKPENKPEPQSAAPQDADEQPDQSFEDKYPIGGKTIKEVLRGEHGEFAGSTSEGGKKEDEKKGRRTKQEEPTKASKSELAKRSMVITDKDIQRYSEEHNEPALAKKLGGLSFPDGEPADIVIGSEGVVQHGVELKTQVLGQNGKITMKASAMERKADWMKKNKADFHTVVFDDSKVKDANGAGKHDESKRVIYYKRGFGSFRTSSMQQVKNVGELKKLIATPTKELPENAKPPKTYNKPASYYRKSEAI